MDNKKDDKYYCQKSLENTEKIQKYTSNLTCEEFLDDNQLIDAVMFRLVQLVENLKNLTEEFRNSNPQIPWGDIFGFRNGIVHEYGKTDYSQVCKIVFEDLDELKELFLE